MTREQLIIGKTYCLPLDGNIFNVTLITTEGENARVLIQDHSIDMSLQGFTKRKKMYSQSVPVRIVPYAELVPYEDPVHKPRGVSQWNE